MLHCGAYAVEREKVAEVATPERTDSWVPIPHIEAIDLACNSLREHGYSIVSEAHGLSHEGARYFGLFDLAGTDGASLDHTMVVGVRNSHDKSFVFGLSCGAHVFVCDNLSFSGEVKVARKHTSRIVADLPRLVHGAVGLLGDLRRTQEQRFIRYKEVEISNPTANDLLVRAMEARVLPVTKLPLALQEWKHPRHEEFRQAGPTLWRLYNSITEAIKGRVEPVRLATPAIHGLFDSAAGFERGKLLEALRGPDTEVQIAG
jgi:hypothetical protein